MTAGHLSRRQYETLVEQAPAMIWRANSAGECDFCNHRWLQFRGCSLEEDANQWTKAVHPEDRKLCLDTYMGAFRMRKPFEMECRLQRQDGNYRWICVRGTPFFGRKSEFLGYIGSCIDVTECMEAHRAPDKAGESAAARTILLVCMECKRIQQADGDWVQMEHYIRNHAPADLSHGLCPNCYAAYYKHMPTLSGPSSGPSRRRNKLEKEIEEARQKALEARSCYKRAEEEYRELTAQAYDAGLHHPDGILAMRKATTHLIEALKQYQTAVSRVTTLLSRI